MEDELRILDSRASDAQDELERSLLSALDPSTGDRDAAWSGLLAQGLFEAPLPEGGEVGGPSLDPVSGGLAPSGTATLGASGKSALLSSLSVKVVSVGLLALAAGAYSVARREPETNQAAAPVARESASAIREPSGEIAPPQRPDPELQGEVFELRKDKPPEARPPRPVPRASKAEASQRSALLEEVRLLQRARQLSSSGQAAEAREVLRELDSRFPQGKLMAERQQLRKALSASP